MAGTDGGVRPGDVFWADLDPVRGHEQGRRRPCIVVSVDEFNRLLHGLVWIVPMTGRLRSHAFTVEISPPEGGLNRKSMVLCHQLRAVSVDRLGPRVGIVSQQTLAEVLARVAMILGR